MEGSGRYWRSRPSRNMPVPPRVPAPNALPRLTDIESGSPIRYDRRVTCNPEDPPEKPVPIDTSVEICSREGSNQNAGRENALTGTLGWNSPVAGLAKTAEAARVARSAKRTA